MHYSMTTVNTDFLQVSSRHSLIQDTNNNSKQDGFLVYGVSGVICFPIVLTILFLVVFVYKAYKTTFQRLILYYITIGLFCELTFALHIGLYFDSQVWICVTTIYLFQYFILAWYVYATAVTNCSFLVILRLIKGSPNIRQGGKLVECICVVLAIVAPVAYMWIPIRDETYEVLNCIKNEPSDRWYEDALVFNTVVLLMSMEVVVVCISLCCTFYFIRKRLQNRQTTILLKNLLYHTVINATMMGLHMLFTIYHFYRYTHPLRSFLDNAVYIISGVSIPLLFFLSIVFQSFLSVKCQSGEGCKCCCRISHRRHHYSVMDSDRNENLTNPTSHPINQPSHTYFSIPYTGAFTQVTSNEHIETEGEGRPLINY